MENEIGPYLLIAAIIALVIAGIWWYWRDIRDEHKGINKLREAYDQALQDGNKRLALQRGREFYARLRGGKLSMFDELAIANDLSTIDNVATAAGTRPQPVQELSK